MEARFCRSRAWQRLERAVVLPWAAGGAELVGDGLEVGAGSGGLAAELLRRNPDLHLTATDYDPQMVEELSRRLQPFGHRARVMQADASSLPFDDNSFDLAFSFLMLHHVGSWEAALTELARVLRPGGRLIGCDVLGRASLIWLERLGGTGDERLASDHELRSQLAALPFEQLVFEPALRNHIARFQARKTIAALTP